MQLGDVKKTFADISLAKVDLNYEPKTNVDQGIEKFVSWFREYYTL